MIFPTMLNSRNPFIFLGHFNEAMGIAVILYEKIVAIPSFS